jgi:hypothetical protein
LPKGDEPPEASSDPESDIPELLADESSDPADDAPDEGEPADREPDFEFPRFWPPAEEVLPPLSEAPGPDAPSGPSDIVGIGSSPIPPLPSPAGSLPGV